MKKRSFFANRKRLFTQAFIFSLVLNLALIAIFFYFFIRENPFPITVDYMEVAPPPREKTLRNQDLLLTLLHLPYDKLVLALNNGDHIEEGVTVRDLALALLVKKEGIDIQRALGREIMPTRTLRIDETKSLALYIDLTDQDFRSLFLFIQEEKWPHTYKALFAKIQECGEETDPELLQMFFQSEEFLHVEKLFSKTSLPIQRKLLFNLIREGNYTLLTELVESQKKRLDLSSVRRRKFLCDYIQAGSKTAALFLLYTEMDYAVKQADNALVERLLDLVPKGNAQSQFFAQKIASSPRPDKVIIKAKKLLG